MDVAKLLVWYEQVKRPLPWRATRDPYALLVSEVMLQQTQASRVIPYYLAFLERFPDPGTLAAASKTEVLQAWSGLGYNRRALNLHAAAKAITESGWPGDLTTLPGVGPYTAAAVGSFAFDRRQAAVDTNVRRVIGRHDGVDRSASDLARRANELVPDQQAATFNQAMMELGAMVCRPRDPDCPACPIQTGCAGPAATPRQKPSAARFEDTDRWARGRVVAALLAGEELPVRLTGERRERVLTGLERDGLIARAADGSPQLPSA